MAKTKLMMLGPPGAGKGTQAQRLATELSIPQISTGDMLREARRKGTEMGRKAAEYMNAGELVPDEVVIGIVDDRLKEEDAQDGFILDGFPRTVAQAEALAEMGVALEAVLNIQVPDDEVIKRLSGRRSCPDCGAVYHVDFSPPAEEGVCDKCGGEDLIQRSDDQPEAIATRLEQYAAKTQPLIDYYDQKGSLVNVPGDQAPEAVEKANLDAIR
jgi:adenylate kinase